MEYMNIEDDVLRFCKSHAWYRTLPLQGKDYLMFPWKGQQPRNTLDLEVEDPEGMHWWFWDADFIDEIPINGIGKDIIMRRPIKFNCFLRGFDGATENRYFAGVGVIRVRFPEVEKELIQKYELQQKRDISFLANLEHFEQVKNAVYIGSQIHELFKTECPEWLRVVSPRLERALTLPSFHSTSGKRYRSPPPDKKRSKSDTILRKKSRDILHLPLTNLDNAPHHPSPFLQREKNNQ